MTPAVAFEITKIAGCAIRCDFELIARKYDVVSRVLGVFRHCLQLSWRIATISIDPSCRQQIVLTRM